jgi:hypothetical protein
MPTTPAIVAKIQFGSDGVPVWIGPRPIRMASAEDLDLEVTVEQLNEASVPPSYDPIDVSQWAASWAAKINIDDADDDAVWVVDGDMTAGASGKIVFSVAAADVNFVANLIPTEISLTPNASVTTRVRVLATLFKPVVA